MLEERVSGLEARMGTADRIGGFLVNKNVTGDEHENVIPLARASVLSYRKEKVVKETLDSMGLENGWLEDKKTDTQAFWYQTGESLIFVFRGTSGAKDVAIDLKRQLVTISVAGKNDMKAHLGFAEAAKSVWPDMRDRINASPECYLWFAGHSLGGAIATIAAYLTLETFGESRIAGLYTIGQPRVFGVGNANRKFMKALGPDRVFRVYRSIDPVPHVPWFRYKHVSGKRCYIKKNGKFVYDARGWKTKLDMAWKFARTIRRFVTTLDVKNLKQLVSDHFSQGYLDDLIYTSTLEPKPSFRERVYVFRNLLTAPFTKGEGIDFNAQAEPSKPEARSGS